MLLEKIKRKKVAKLQFYKDTHVYFPKLKGTTNLEAEELRKLQLYFTP